MKLYTQGLINEAWQRDHARQQVEAERIAREVSK